MRIMIAVFLLCGFLLAVAATIPVADHPNFGHWTAAELRGYEKPLHEQVSGPNKTSSVKLGDYGSSNVAISHREAYGIPEVHDQMDDYFIVQSGSATLIIGGSVINPKRQDDRSETRGDGITGGDKRTIRAGDVVHIPARMPHQLLVKPGSRFTYFVIKVKAG